MSKAWDEMVNGTGGAFQYSTPINPYTSNIGFDFTTKTAQDQRMRGMNDSVGLDNWRLRNQQTQFDNQQSMLKDMFSGKSGGDVGAPSTVNRFDAGLTDAESRLRALLDNPDSIKQSGAYKFRVKQGEEALQRNLGAKGLLNSGNRLMELTKYGQDMGSQEYDNQAGRLSSLLGMNAQAWLGDKNANTSIYSAQNTAKANNDRTALGWAGLNWDMSKPQVMGGSRSSGGSDRPLYGFGPSAADAWGDVLQNDIAEAKLKQIRGY